MTTTTITTINTKNCPNTQHTANPTVNYIHIPAFGFLRLATVLQVFPVSRTTWYKGIRAGRYPRPIRIEKSINVWDVDEIRKLIERVKNNAKASTS